MSALTVQRNERLEKEKALKILAKSIFKELKSQGYETKYIVGLATELISHVTTDLSTQAPASRPGADSISPRS